MRHTCDKSSHQAQEFSHRQQPQKGLLGLAVPKSNGAPLPLLAIAAQDLQQPCKSWLGASEAATRLKCAVKSPAPTRAALQPPDGHVSIRWLSK